MVRRGTWEEGVRVASPFMRLTWIAVFAEDGRRRRDDTSNGDDSGRALVWSLFRTMRARGGGVWW